jgi:hypothetical protein
MYKFWEVNAAVSISVKSVHVSDDILDVLLGIVAEDLSEHLLKMNVLDFSVLCIFVKVWMECGPQFVSDFVKRFLHRKTGEKDFLDF